MRGTNIDCGRRIVDNLIGRNVKIFGYEQNIPKAISSSSETWPQSHYNTRGRDQGEVKKISDDPSIIPASTNGRTDDPRVGKPWDWLAVPNKQP